MILNDYDRLYTTQYNLAFMLWNNLLYKLFLSSNVKFQSSLYIFNTYTVPVFLSAF